MRKDAVCSCENAAKSWQIGENSHVEQGRQKICSAKMIYWNYMFMKHVQFTDQRSYMKYDSTRWRKIFVLMKVAINLSSVDKVKKS